ncbi:MAG: hypothetical protein COT43_05180 [Candidatus Marinimicrobia bacterium CG08_land_8_20_14_0_20_45_22]|nr:MAG: hypothetical protein COT43_05180 [Candidatus Marinimicrobia bacterium CG08_land_8_20_14_0_20_45_22]
MIADTTYFSRNEGVCIFYSSTLNRVVDYSIITYEKSSTYLELRRRIERKGFTITAVVIDGRKGVREVFSGIPVQMCQFHQLMILRRYLTLNPRLESAGELKEICKYLCKMEKDEFIYIFNKWSEKWFGFLSERTRDDAGKWHYTHRRLRSARRSIFTNLPYLFTYQDYPDLGIPNTTNCLESLNAKLKELTRVHRGYSKQVKLKIIAEILAN